MSAGVRSNPSILVMGEALVDVVTRGDDVDEHVGGSPANVAFGLGRLGHDVALATWIGADRRGKRIARACRRADVELVPGSDKAPRTSVANAEIDAEGHATYNFDLTWVLPTLPHISEVDHVHTGSIAATLEPGGTQVVGALKATHGEATISYDPNARPTLMGDPQDARNRVEEIVVLSDVVKVSDQDVEWFYPDRAIDDVVQDWLAMGPSLVVSPAGARARRSLCAVPTRSWPPVPTYEWSTRWGPETRSWRACSRACWMRAFWAAKVPVSSSGRPHPAMCSRLCSGQSQRPA